MRDLIILGTGIHSLEMVEIVERINAVQPTWNLLGYCSADGSGAGELRNEYPILGGVDVLSEFPIAGLVPEFGWPKDAGAPREMYVSIIDPSCFVSRGAKIGCGCVIYPSCYIGYNAQLGNDIFCLSSSVINHDDVIEDGVTFATGVRLAGRVHVGQGTYLGQACTVRETTKIGPGCLIGTGAVVLKDVPANSVMVGNPARKLRNKC